MGGDVPLAYATYWERKRLLSGPVPTFPLRRWWATDGLCDVEQAYWDAIRPAARLLDVGAGDLRVMKKFRAAGFAGEYHTQDIGAEFAYDEAVGPLDRVGDLPDACSQLHAERCAGTIGIRCAQWMEPVLGARQHDAAVDGHLALAHPARKPAARKFRQQAGERLIEAQSGALHRHGERDARIGRIVWAIIRRHVFHRAP